MLLSVIIPIYNGELYLEQSIMSVLQQPCRDLEVICVNDGSTDNSLEVLDLLSAQDSRIRVISQANQGVASARNLGISMATGVYTAFLDQDDVYFPNFITQELQQRISRDTWDLVSFAYYYTNENLSRGKLNPRDCVQRKNLSQYAAEHYRHHSSYFYRTDFLKDNRILVDRHRNEDERFRMQCVYLAQSALYLPNVSFLYRNNSRSVTHQKGRSSSTLVSCIDGYTQLMESSLHPDIVQYCKDTKRHLLLELAAAMAEEDASVQELQQMLETYGYSALYAEKTWMSDQDIAQWDLLISNPKGYILKQRRRAHIKAVLRKIQSISFIQNIYERKKYPIDLFID